MLKELIQINSTSKFVNPFWEYKVDEYKMPNGKTGEYHYVNSRGATMIIPVTMQKKFVMIKQYRYLNKKTSIEFPGGGIINGLNPLDNAKKELSEETGYTASTLKLLGEYNPYNGITNEICHVFMADGLNCIKPKPDESEEFEIMEYTQDEIRSKIYNGEIWDGMTIAAWSIYLINSEKN
ncbi:MAG: NUDIX hydrolase [Bacteroidetes bacterium]|nr:MAG: NUDIX hydrolase [Bacteroidota bacterium]